MTFGTLQVSFACSGGRWSGQIDGINALALGTPLKLSAVQSGGTPVTKSITRADMVTIASSIPSQVDSGTSSLAVSGTCLNNGENVNVSLNLVGTGQASGVFPCTGGRWSGSLDISSLYSNPGRSGTSSGARLIARHGGVQASRRIRIQWVEEQAEGGVVTIADAVPSSLTSEATRLAVSGTCTLDNTNVQVTFGSLDEVERACSGGQWSHTIDVSALQGGQYILRVVQDNGDPETKSILKCHENYSLVPGNTDYTAEDFCAMKYEAKAMLNDESDYSEFGCADDDCDAGTPDDKSDDSADFLDVAQYKPSSVAANQPWVGISPNRSPCLCISTLCQIKS